ncbi:dienelactone hydrolase family protein [Sporosarcina oncorhynchi]|uniref:Dienelactone hydrolase family protein n=1 Tax=Sporosarcina oncorhynchi TaxID=3056444 RepID=A0ABZ0L7A2_9BACL|nr:dienelactone hydrolase family protein [Sporosarcina sp. T2O-4]WOV87259.1 dienelactone hydrolase family protein [Sporosarcina sp. T2O-4]
MVTIKQGYKNAVIVVHEIYGLNQHIREFCGHLSALGFDVYCPSLLNRDESYRYDEEQLAYRNFMENIGFVEAAKTVKQLAIDIEQSYEKIFVVGYSVGATVAWLCGNKKMIKGIIGYYGSRIRDYLDKPPECPTLLFFPKEENSFDVNRLITSIDAGNIEIYTFERKHGFGDPYSPNYQSMSASKAFNQMADFLLKHSTRS